MIEQKEISKQSAVNNVSDRQIEKDYILSWILFGISKNATLFPALVFKGGTVLKKAYFKDYRYSEDLDFTLLDEMISDDQILTEFQNLLLFIKDMANIDIRVDKKKWIKLKNENIQFYIDYVGPLLGQMGSRDIKIDITRNEKIETEINLLSIFRDYSDIDEDFKLNCYSLAEILIEKMAAIMGRSEARDLYDFWYLTKFEKLDVQEFINPFFKKAERKKHNPKELLIRFLSREKIYRRDWDTKLSSQVHNLPEFDVVFREAKKHVKF